MTKIYQQQVTIDPIQTTNKAGNCSVKYKHVNTADVIERFEQAGLKKVGASYAGVKTAAREGYQKHMVVFDTDYTVGDSKLQLLLINSHDASSSFQVSIGIYRFACANGLVVGDTFGTERVRHVGNVIVKIDQAIDKQLERLPMVAQAVEKMMATKITTSDTMELVKRATDLRVGDKAEAYVFTNRVEQRKEDEEPTLWNVFNIIQERMIRGGLFYVDAKTGDTKKTRVLKSIPRTVKLNRELFDTAVKLAA